MFSKIYSMGFTKDDKEKEFICKQCNTFLDTNELVNGKCPNCENDEDLFINHEDEE